MKVKKVTKIFVIALTFLSVGIEAAFSHDVSLFEFRSTSDIWHVQEGIPGGGDDSSVALLVHLRRSFVAFLVSGIHPEFVQLLWRSRLLAQLRSFNNSFKKPFPLILRPIILPE